MSQQATVLKPFDVTKFEEMLKSELQRIVAAYGAEALNRLGAYGMTRRANSTVLIPLHPMILDPPVSAVFDQLSSPVSSTGYEALFLLSRRGLHYDRAGFLVQVSVGRNSLGQVRGYFRKRAGGRQHIPLPADNIPAGIREDAFPYVLRVLQNIK